jgi:hypothetical protein
VAWFPLAALAALLKMRESPVHLERRRRQLHEAAPACQGLSVPATSPAVYIPFFLIAALISLQHFSGFTYTKRFLLQVLDATNGNSTTVGGNSTEAVVAHDNSAPLNTDSYYWGMLVCCVYLLSSMLVARLLRSIRRRFMFFLSLLLTSLCLIAIGFLMDEHTVSALISQETILLLKVTFLCLHVFVVQCGLQGLPTQLTDILFPSSCKSIMKGICRAVTSLTLVIFIAVINSFPIFVRFWIMAGTLIVASPLLFIFIPEIRNIGKSTAGNFLLPVQTVFYILLPKEDMRKKWKVTVKKLNMMKAFINTIDKKLAKEEALDSCTTYSKTFTFLGDLVDLKDFRTDKELRRSNCELVSYIANTLPGSGVLPRHWREDRILVGRGPTKFPNDVKLKNGGMFLFDDVLILAKCLLRNWRYVNEISFAVTELQVTRHEMQLELVGPESSVTIAFTDSTEAEMWKRYIEFCKTSFDETRGSQSPDSENAKETETLL